MSKSLKLEPMYQRNQVQLKKILKYATFERILGQELYLFEVDSIEVLPLFLVIPVNAAFLACLPSH